MPRVIHDPRPSFGMAVLDGRSGAQNDLIAFHSHLIGPKLFLGVELVLSAGEIEGPVMPRTTYYRPVLADVALAQRGALMDAPVGERVELPVGAKYRDRSSSGAERAALAVGEIPDLAKAKFGHSHAMRRMKIPVKGSHLAENTGPSDLKMIYHAAGSNQDARRCNRTMTDCVRSWRNARSSAR